MAQSPTMKKMGPYIRLWYLQCDVAYRCVHNKVKANDKVGRFLRHPVWWRRWCEGSRYFEFYWAASTLI